MLKDCFLAMSSTICYKNLAAILQQLLARILKECTKPFKTEAGNKNLSWSRNAPLLLESYFQKSNSVLNQST